ncbi:MAG: outer membrane lipoprotein-sorting protein, partial [Phycisphaerales bacterium]|nr:outer membrane lipoprotein-sorting protein [Phycisphaerales bacterium]
MHVMKNLSGLFVLASALVVVTNTTVLAQSAQQKGLEIAKELDRRDLGWGDSTATLKMVLKNRQGQTSTRELRTFSFEVNAPGLGDRSMTVFDRPGDIRGTALLSYTKILQPDDQWLFLPAIKRVKRISSSNKSGPFVGSEFAYEDLLSNEVERYTYKWI